MLLALMLAVIVGCAGVTIRLRTPPTIPATATTVATATATSTAIPPTSTPIPTATETATPTIIPTDAPAVAISAVRVGQNPYSTTLQIVSARGVTRSVEVNYLLYLPQDYGQDRPLVPAQPAAPEGCGSERTRAPRLDLQPLPEEP